MDIVLVENMNPSVYIIIMPFTNICRVLIASPATKTIGAGSQVTPL